MGCSARVRRAGRRAVEQRRDVCGAGLHTIRPRPLKLAERRSSMAPTAEEKKLLKEMAKALEGVSDDEDDEEDAARAAAAAKAAREQRRRPSLASQASKIGNEPTMDLGANAPPRSSSAQGAGRPSGRTRAHAVRQRGDDGGRRRTSSSRWRTRRSRGCGGRCARWRSRSRRHLAQPRGDAPGPTSGRAGSLRQDVCEEEGRGGRLVEEIPSRRRCGARGDARGAREGAPRLAAISRPPMVLESLYLLVLEAAPLARRLVRAVGARRQDDGRRLALRSALARRRRSTSS